MGHIDNKSVPAHLLFQQNVLFMPVQLLRSGDVTAEECALVLAAIHVSKRGAETARCARCASSSLCRTLRMPCFLPPQQHAVHAVPIPESSRPASPWFFQETLPPFNFASEYSVYHCIKKKALLHNPGPVVPLNPRHLVPGRRSDVLPCPPSPLGEVCTLA